LSQSEAKVESSGARVKPEPNLSQSEAKVESSGARVKPEPNLSQSEAKVESSGARVKPEPNLSQSEARVQVSGASSKPTYNVTELSSTSAGLSWLVGLQRKVIEHLYISARHSADQCTPALSIQSVADAAQTTCCSVRKAIQRLEEKGCIHRVAFKDGRGGWTRYRIPFALFDAIASSAELKPEPNLSQSEAEVRPNLS
jgi:hypothetical protein